MRRLATRLFSMALGAVVVGMPLSGLTQQAEKPYRIGVLSLADRSSTKIFDAFREGLRDLGYIDGQNITIEYRLAAGDFSRLPVMTGELVQRPVDVIVIEGGAKLAQIVHDATSTIPIVGALGSLIR